MIDVPRGTSHVALLVSGGLDSYVALRCAVQQSLAHTALWVDMGQRYGDNERSSLRRLGVEHTAIALGAANHDAGIEGYLRAPGYCGLVGDIVPGRNLLLATLAASFGDLVWLCALDGEMHPYSNRDKSHEWFLSTSAALSYSFRPVRPVTRVETPFAHLTKGGVVRLALDIGITVDELRLTSSCYAGGDVPCGECPTCFKRWCAFTVNDITEQYVVPPWSTRYAEDAFTACALAREMNDYDYRSKGRVDETLAAWATVR